MAKLRLLALLLAFACTACVFDTHAPESSTRNQGPKPHALSGRLLLPDGHPAAGAEVSFYPVDYHPRAAAKRTASGPDSTRTDGSGSFSVRLPDGQYNVLAQADSLRAFQDSVTLSAEGLELSPLSLRTPGSIHGRVALQPNHNPRTAFIELLGSNFYVNVDDSGRFDLERIPEGIYTLAARTTESGYTSRFLSLEVHSGESVVLAEPIEPIFTDIPAVRELRAQYDTAAGVARISWHPSEYFGLQDYLISRDSAGALAVSPALGAVQDTFFSDTLYRNGWPMGFTGHPDSLPLDLEYRVRVHAKTDSAGPVFEVASLRAVPPAWVSTHIDLRVLGGKGDSGRAGDSIRIAASFRNRTRKIVSLSWSLGSDSAAIRARNAGLSSGEDTLSMVWDRPAHLWVKLSVRDDAGSTRTDSLSVAVVLDAPVASAVGDILVPIHGAIHLTPQATTRFGRISGWEWDIGNTGTFRTAKDTAVPAPSSPDTNYLCVLRVTADNGLMGLDTLRVRVVPWIRLADAPCMGLSDYGYYAAGPSRAVVDGKLYSLCADDPYFPKQVQMQVFDPQASLWTAKATAPNLGEGTRAYAMRAIGEILYLPNPGNLLAYDPATDQWSVKAKPPTTRTYNAEIGIPSIVVDGKLYLVGGSEYEGREGTPTGKMDIYNPISDTWKSGAPLPISASRAGSNWGNTYHLIAARDRLVLYTSSVFTSGSLPYRTTYLYDAAADAWAMIDSANTRNGVNPPLAGTDGKVYVQGESDAFDVAALKWVPAGLPPSALEYHSEMAATGDRLIFSRTEGVATDPSSRPRAPFTTYFWSWQLPSGAWEPRIPVRADVELMTLEPVGDRLFLFTGDMNAPMETFEYFLP